jgi:tRNA (guanine-N7-)-methyltransferase
MLWARMQKIKPINQKNLPTLWPENISGPDLFNNDNPIDLEIGCGRPHFFFDRALHFPDRNVIGIEWKFAFISQAERRIVRENIKNARAFHGNAWLLVPLLFSSGSISQVMVNFPDPWWKERHKKRLLLNECFLKVLYKLIKDDGFILLQTDVKELFEYYCQLMTETGLFIRDMMLSNEDIAMQNMAQTHREKKCIEQGLSIYRGIFRRRA